jgi:hypothetical protein
MLAVAGLILGLAPWALPARADDKAAANAKARLAAARKVYEGMLVRRKVDPAESLGSEKLYLWSRRWMEAQRELADKKEDKVAAVQGHLDRMKEMEAVVKQMRDRKIASEADVAAQEFYRLEAEQWLAQAGGK